MGRRGQPDGPKVAEGVSLTEALSKIIQHVGALRHVGKSPNGAGFGSNQLTRGLVQRVHGRCAEMVEHQAPSQPCATIRVVLPRARPEPSNTRLWRHSLTACRPSSSKRETCEHVGALRQVRVIRQGLRPVRPFRDGTPIIRLTATTGPAVNQRPSGGTLAPALPHSATQPNRRSQERVRNFHNGFNGFGRFSLAERCAGFIL